MKDWLHRFSVGKEIYSFYYGESATAYNLRLGLAPCCEWGRIFCL